MNPKPLKYGLVLVVPILCEVFHTTIVDQKYFLTLPIK